MMRHLIVVAITAKEKKTRKKLHKEIEKKEGNAESKPTSSVLEVRKLYYSIALSWLVLSWC